MFARSFVICLLLPGCIVVGKDFEDTGDGAEFQARVDAAVQAALAQQVVVTLIEEDTVWNVAPGDDLPALLRRLDRYLVASDATLTLQFEAGGTYTLAGPIHLHHPSGGRIRIQGDDDNPAILVLNGTDGLIVDESSALGFFGGVELQQIGEAGDTAGVRVSDASSGKLGTVSIEGFRYGLAVERGASVEAADAGVSASRVWVGITATGGSHVAAKGARLEAGEGDGGYGVLVQLGSVAEVDSAVVANFEYGVLARTHSSVSATAASVSGGVFPFHADSHSYLGAATTLAEGAAGSGFTSGSASFLDATGATSRGSAYEGFYSFLGAYLRGEQSVATSNKDFAYRTDSNGVIYADGAAGDTDTSGGNESDVIDFIIGLPE